MDIGYRSRIFSLAATELGSKRVVSIDVDLQSIKACRQVKKKCEVEHWEILEGSTSGIDVYQTGGQRECRLSVDEYARIYMRSKIALNFCYHPNLIAQCKSRVFEATLCGAMLLEADNSETARRFEPMVDYVPFTDETDLVEKVRYYLAHESERMEIAARGHQKAKKMYTGDLFWKTVFRRAFSTNF